jgi:hypothetical protein
VIFVQKDLHNKGARSVTWNIIVGKMRIAQQVRRKETKKKDEKIKRIQL